MTHSVIQRPAIVIQRNVTRVAVRETTRRVVSTNPTRAVRSQSQVTRTVVTHRGPQGEQGEPGEGADLSGYTHSQASASTTWTVPHNLGRKPLVSPLTTGGLEMIGAVLHVSTNLLTITFASAQAGTARCL